MNNYSKYLNHAQKVYFKDVLVKSFPDAICSKFYTYWENDQNLPLHIEAEVTIRDKKYTGILEYRNHAVRGYTTNYGMINLCLLPYSNEDEDFEKEDVINMVINPVSLESNLNYINNPDVFYKALAYWAEYFKSDRYDSPMDGITIPDLRDVVLTYEKAQRKV